MRLTGKRSNYAKRAKQFANIMQMYFGVSENISNEAITKLAPIVRYFKCKNVYLTKNGNDIEVNTIHDDQICSILLNVYIENESVYCEDTISLLFPSLENKN